MRAALIAVLVCAACATQPRSRMATGMVVSDEEVRAVIRRALEADAANQPSDTLFTAGATIIANGKARLSPPRFAGIGRGGLLALQSLSVEMSPPLAWGEARYQWGTRGGTSFQAGAATFILEHTDHWRIVHAHSSTPLPWIPNQ